MPLGAPADWSEADGHCGALFVRREQVGGVAFMRSAWEVETAEAALFLVGARLTLGVAGHCHPVVHLQVTDLPPDFEPAMTARRFTSPDGRSCVRVEMIYPYGGHRRAYAEVEVTGGLGSAVAAGIDLIEGLAQREGWTATKD